MTPKMGTRIEWCTWGEGLGAGAQVSGLSLNHVVFGKDKQQKRQTGGSTLCRFSGGPETGTREAQGPSSLRQEAQGCKWPPLSHVCRWGGAPSGDKNPARNSPEGSVEGQRANGCQDVDEQARAGEVSGEGRGKDQEKLEICQNPRGVRYSRG